VVAKKNSKRIEVSDLIKNTVKMEMGG